MLKALNFSELEQLAESLAAFRGAQLKSVSGDDRVLALRWSLENTESGAVPDEKTLWVNVDRQLMTFSRRCPRVRNSKKPLILFLKSRAIDLAIGSVELQPEFGRVLILKMVSEACDDIAEIEFRLFPQGKNIIARFGDKQVSSLKPKPLEKIDFSVEKLKDPAGIRSSEDIVLALEESLSKKDLVEPAANDLVKKLKRDLKKKQRALQQLTEKIESKDGETWQRVGLWLQQNQSLHNIPEHFSAFVDSSQTFSSNLSHCFDQAKKEKAKLQGRLDQLQKLKLEINDLERKIDNPAAQLKQLQKQSQSKKNDLMQAAKVKGRRRELSDGLRVSMGKSGADNLKLLRRAKPWYFWFHLKDFPGSHAIVEVNKGQSLDQNQVDEISQWLIKESLGTRAVVDEGYAVIWAECRYVTPIKGDKLGRVRYTGEHSQTIRFR